MLEPGGTAPSSKLAEKLPPRATPARARAQPAVRITNRVEENVIFIECLLLWLTHVPNVIRLTLNWPLPPRIVNSILAVFLPRTGHQSREAEVVEGFAAVMFLGQGPPGSTWASSCG